MITEEIKREIRKFALMNAIDHGGKANPGAVMGKLMATHPELKKEAKTLIGDVKAIAEEVNSLSTEEQKEVFAREFGDIEEHRIKKERSEGLPPLKMRPEFNNTVVMRFAPGPSGPLHIGHSRAAVLNDEYVKMYKGKFILRIEDTNPEKIDPDAYDTFLPDLEWLGVEVHETYIQSDRFDIYLDYARKLLEMGHAYICTCDVEKWRELKLKKKPCPHRDLPPEVQLEEWEKMLNGHYGQGEASYVVKTDLEHPNPAIRDFVGFRILDKEHPRTGDKYHVYPLYNFAVAIDDHLMGMTHILRGKDHLNNTLRQEYIYDYFGWWKPEFIHYGWVSIEDTVLKKSLITQGIKSGEYSGWDDIRLGTFRALRARGIQPEAIRKYWIKVGIKPVDIEFSWDNLYAYNREIVDPIAPRFFFVWDPVEILLETSEAIEIKAPVHPDHPERGWRHYTLEPEDGIVRLYGVRDDFNGSEGKMLRLKDACNIEVLDVGDAVKARYAGNDLSVIRKGVRIVHAIPTEGARRTEVFLPDGGQREGFCEGAIGDTTGVVQFERFGFVNIVSNTPEGIRANFAHR